MNKKILMSVVVVAMYAGPWAATAAAGPLRPPEVKVSRTPGRVVLEVADDGVTVRKEIRPDTSVATITTSRDELTMAVKRGVLTISGPGGSRVLGKDGAAGHGRLLGWVQRSEAATRGPAPLGRVGGRDGGGWRIGGRGGGWVLGKEGGAGNDRLLVVLKRSEAAAMGRALLARVAEGPETFVGQSLLLTRALLEFGTGSTGALTQHKRWVAQRAALAAIRPATTGRTLISWQKTGPGDCWDMYSAEAIRIAKDFEECTADLKWYEAHLWAGCSVIYAVRAEGAMAWFIACNGGVPFSG